MFLYFNARQVWLVFASFGLIYCVHHDLLAVLNHTAVQNAVEKK